MADVVARIFGFGHGPDGNRPQDAQGFILFRQGCQFIEGAGNVFRGGHVHFYPHLAGKTRQFFNFVRIGLVVNAVYKGNFGAILRPFVGDKRGDLFIGQEHEVFDQHVRVLALFGEHLDGYAIFIQPETHFFRFEVDGTFFEALFAQLVSKSIEHF